jgi:glycerol-3-phosphate O-acyltransferase
LFSSALKLAENYGLLDPGTPDLAQRRRDLADELRTIGIRISRAAALDPSNRAPQGTV